MKKSLRHGDRKGDFTQATIALATLCGLVATVAFLPASCQGQDADGVQRLMLRLQQMDVEHNPGPCTTASKLRSEALTSASSSRVLAPHSGNKNEAVPPVMTSNSFQPSAQAFGVLSPVIAPGVFDPEPNVATQFDGPQSGFPQEPGTYLNSVPASLVSSTSSTRTLTPSQASTLWKTYCTKDDCLAPTTSGVAQDCSAREN
jgi:hypothetical protein